jgi:hypothetical protein
MAKTTTGFRPGALSIRACEERINTAAKKRGFSADKGIVTSKDRVVMALQSDLQTTNVPPGFEKWQLPISLNKSMMFIAVAEPNAEVPEHKHKGAGIRVILAGSAIHAGKELGPGDWMYIPANTAYKLTIGATGARMFYCYNC